MYRYAYTRASYMAGKATAAPYISGTRPSREDDNGEVRHNPVVPGQMLATYKSLYNSDEFPAEALAVLGCYVDEGEIVYTSKASALHPIAMSSKGGGELECDTKLVNTAEQYSHMRQLPESPDMTEHYIREGLWEILTDLLVDVKDSVVYYEFHD